MMKDYVICIDASVDIDQNYIDKNNIVIIPMKYILGETEKLMENRLSDAALVDFYNAMRAGEMTHTSQITPYYYQQVFRREAEKGHDILYISLSGGLSSTYASALSAAEEITDEFEERHEALSIEVVDSRAATGGMGLLLMMAVRARENGVSLSDNAAALRANAGKVCHWFLVDDLSYLRRGGRISAATAVAGTVLNIKPILKIADDGTLISIAKKRGLAKAAAFLTDCYRDAYDPALPSDVIVAHADCLEEAEAARDRVLSINPDANVEICGLGPVIGAHTGPGMMAVIHWGNRNHI
ncbi:MAG TPA: DegV family protein [Lachnospiraceae bacterium]|nr:DegV family protein [Lachnospiraceae bacterium]